MSTIAIIHFSPLEQYPPVQNFVNDLESAVADEKIIVLTQACKVSGLSWFQTANGRAKIIRVRNVLAGRSRVSRLANYLSFNLTCIYYLVRLAPCKVLYYETLSSFPVYLYKKFIRRDVPVCMHYHEYTSPQEYRSGMLMVRWFRNLEGWLHPRAKWISHTNHGRLDLFKKDILPTKIDCGYVFPNYPPRSWFREPVRVPDEPLRVVYVGALSMKTMYTREFSEWIAEQQGRVIWDIYTYNCTDDAIDYIKSQRSPWINLREGINYSTLPEALRNYHVGVILYKGHIPNYIYNAPNKLFEYLACGLSVWYPEIMSGCDPYKTDSAFPQVLALDFNSIKGKKAEQIMPIRDLPYKEQSYYSENASLQLIQHLLVNDK